MAPPHYSVYGLSIACDVPLPELVALEGPAPVPDIAVSWGGALEPGAFASSEEDRHLDREHGYLAWPGVGAFHLRAGRAVLATPERGAAELAVRSTLLGPVLSMALFQRGFLAVHGSAVALPGASGSWGVVAFLGESGEGKSTMAAALHARGYPVVADDTIAVPPASLRGQAHPRVAPGSPYLNLWPRSLAALGRQSLGKAHASGLPGDKSACRFGEPPPQQALPLRRIYVLGTGPTLQVKALPPAMCVVELARHCHRAGLLPDEQQAEIFQACGVLASQVPVRSLLRPRDLSRLSDVARLVEADQDGASESSDRIFDM